MDQVAETLAYLAGMRVCVKAWRQNWCRAGIGFVAGELEAIVLCFERKISLHSKS